MDYSVNDNSSTGIKGGGISTEYAAGALVLGCLLALILIRRGFRGVGVPGVGSVKVG